jgi:protein-S-isoprenylcysteine O-methyltransferase Ste14
LSIARRDWTGRAATGILAAHRPPMNEAPPSTPTPPATDRPWVLGQSVLMLAVVALGVAHRGAWQNDAAFAAGAALFALGAVVGVWGVRSLGGSRTPNPTPKTDAELVQHGIYRRLRHPLYSSVMLASLGWALLWQSAAALLATAVLCVFFDAKARLEERLLLAKFPEYAAYRGLTWRFIPWVY